MLIERKLLSVRDAATVLGIPEKTIYDWALKGSLPSLKIGARRMIPLDAVKAIVNGEAA